MKQLAFPGRISFDDFFPKSHLCEPADKSHALATFDASDRDNPRAKSSVNSSGSIRGDKLYRCFRIDSISSDVLDFIEGSMIAIPHDSISFEVVIRGDGTALVLARYSQIIGSRWLGIVDADTLPMQCGACARIGTNDTTRLVHAPGCPKKGTA